jgi:hypothetical protein
MMRTRIPLGVANQPLAFAITHAFHGLAAIIATVTSVEMAGETYRFVAAGSIAKRSRKTFAA